ncbi:MAG: D-cysteine desulfhydrase family protein [Herbinix sp.]|jgi:D-cysteine desulfhydrase family pyridoxal phosphate-dependent enzyme|nr:D-cysteine desulfhydrase family protein [Herbinix sp.]
MNNYEDVNKHLTSRPKVNLGFFPTPLHKLDKLSAQLGVNLYLKRDDMTGYNLFGGNKIRKLEYLIGDAVAQGCDTVFTFGATQSNHAMQTVTACRRYGLKPILYLVAIVEPGEEDLRANMLIDTILGAEIHIVSLNGKTEAEADELAVELAQKHRETLEQQGHKCYMVPMGGANPLGSAGFISGFVELNRQLEEIGQKADYLFHSTGTGGTLAGLAAGKKLLNSDTSIISINASPKPFEHYSKVAKLATEALTYLGSDQQISEEDLNFDQNYYAPGYEIPNEGSSNAIKLLARTEGLLLDPVYTGKAFSGMLDYIQTRKIPQGSTVVFWHTGGVTALFAEKEIVGDLT